MFWWPSFLLVIFTIGAVLFEIMLRDDFNKYKELKKKIKNHKFNLINSYKYQMLIELLILGFFPLYVFRKIKKNLTKCPNF